MYESSIWSSNICMAELASDLYVWYEPIRAFPSPDSETAILTSTASLCLNFSSPPNIPLRQSHHDNLAMATCVCLLWICQCSSAIEGSSSTTVRAEDATERERDRLGSSPTSGLGTDKWWWSTIGVASFVHVSGQVSTQRNGKLTCYFLVHGVRICVEEKSKTDVRGGEGNDVCGKAEGASIYH